MAIVLQSTIMCPVCGHAETETMPEDSCVIFYECRQCGTMLRPLQGEDCVFCSFGTERCPDKQREVQGKRS